MFATRAEGPWAGAVLATLTKELARGWPPGLTVLTGGDAFHLERAQRALLAHLVPDEEGAYAISMFGGDPISAASLVGAARSGGMFADRRVVFLRDVASLEGDPEPLAGFAADPPRSSFILVRAPKLDRKRKLHKTLAEAGRCLVFRPASSDAEVRELVREMTALAAERGVTLEPAGADFLLAVCGPDLHRIVSELDKVAAWLGDQAATSKVDAGPLRGLVAGAGLMSGWELADALTERDPASALAAARRLLDAGEEPIRILGGLASRARALLKAKAMTEAGASAKSVVDASRAWYFRDALQRGLERYTLDDLLAMPRHLQEADRTFKSRAIDKGAVLEALMITLTARPPEAR